MDSQKMQGKPKQISRVRLKKFASYVPSTVVDNNQILQEIGTEPASTTSVLERVVGSKEKRAAKKDEMGSDMMARVGTQILEECNLGLAGIDKLICSCDPQDQAAPDTAVITQARMGLTCPAFGISMSCSAWLCGILIGSGFLANGDRRILVLAASTVGSKYFFKHPMHRAIFGDGAGGVLLEETEERGNILALDLWTDGRFYREIFAPHPWSTVPDKVSSQYKDAFYMSPDNRIFFEAIDTYIRPFYLKQYETAGIQKDDVKFFIIHQASMPIFKHTLKSLDIPEHKVVGTFDRFGNTVSAELPIIIDQVIRGGKTKQGDIIYSLTYGAGFTAGAMIFRI